MTRIITTLLFFIVAISPSFSQEKPAQLIYLLDGSFIKGTVMDTSISDQITVQLSDSSVINVSKNLLWQIRKNNSDEIILPNGKRVLGRGLYSSVSMHTLAGQRSTQWEESMRWGLGLHYSIGWQFRPALSIGGGLGLDAHEHFLMPLFMEVRGFLTRKKYKIPENLQDKILLTRELKSIKARMPFCYQLQLGYNMPVDKIFNGDIGYDFKGGWLLYPSIGVMFPSRSGTSLRLDVGYKFQKFSRTTTYEWWGSYTQTDKIMLKSFATRISWVF